ncbi:MAG: RNA-binding protein [Planctomycetia bacterium]|nr:RNA-binding protein [Planctomycetia bacterium]
MSFKIYAGNLPWLVTDQSLREIFEPFGAVLSAEVVIDRRNGRARGFGFVRMESADVAQNAIAALHGMNWHDRPIRVAPAKDSVDDPPATPAS